MPQSLKKKKSSPYTAQEKRTHLQAMLFLKDKSQSEDNASKKEGTTDLSVVAIVTFVLLFTLTRSPSLKFEYLILKG